MNLRLFVLAAAAGAAVLGTGLAARAPIGAAQFGVNAGDPARGKYIVTRVGMCIDCHGQNLHGMTLPFGPVAGAWPPGVKFERHAPSLVAKMAGAPADKWVRFFETGVDPTGQHPDPPMPSYRLNHADAQSLVAYLKSVH